MAKKKGGKKGKKKNQQSLDTEQAQDAPQTADQPAISDAVSEVIGGGQDTSESKKQKKLKSQIAKFAADGYDVSELEAMAESDDLAKAVSDFEAGIPVVGQIKKDLESVDVAGVEAEAEELRGLIAHPMKHVEAAEKFAGLKFKKRIKEIASTLDRMVLPAMKDKVDAMRAMLDNSKDLEAIEVEFSTLKMDYKAAYAEEGVKAQIVSADTEPARGANGRAKAPMEVNDIFLLYKNGKFISHHRETALPKDQQHRLMSDLKTGRSFLLSPKYAARKLNIIPAENRYILVQSGAYTVIICIVSGSVDPFTENIISRVINLMETEDLAQLKDWNGDVANLKSCNKYMLALMGAFKKLREKRR